MQPKEESINQAIVTEDLGDKIAAHISTKIHLPSLISDTGRQLAKEMAVLFLAKEYAEYTQGKANQDDPANLVACREKLKEIFTEAAEVVFQQTLAHILESKEEQSKVSDAIFNFFSTDEKDTSL